MTDRLVALVLGLAVAVAGLLAAAELSSAAGGEGLALVPLADWDQALASAAWSDRSVGLVGAGVMVGGAVLLFLQLVPRRPGTVALEAPEDRPSLSLQRRSLEVHLVRVLTDLPEVDGATVRVGRRRAHASVRPTARADSSEVRQRSTEVVEARLADLGLARRRRVDVVVRDPAKARVS